MNWLSGIRLIAPGMELSCSIHPAIVNTLSRLKLAALLMFWIRLNGLNAERGHRRLS